MRGCAEDAAVVTVGRLIAKRGFYITKRGYRYKLEEEMCISSGRIVLGRKAI